ncbi:MAG: hypothetical protein J6Y62_00475 [Clostridia bacterium]|nr:hypothetical protein [Clostridia bacterium]
MKAEFYSLKDKKHIEAEVTGKKTLGNGRKQIVGSYNGRTVVKFVKDDEYNGKFKSVKVVD